MRKQSLFLTTAVVAAGLGILGLTGATMAHEAIGVTWLGSVYTIDTHDGTGALLNGNTGFYSLNAMAKAPNGTMYVAGRPSVLLTVDPNDGSLTVVAALSGFTPDIRGMACDSRGRLYVYNDEGFGNPDILYAIDVNTGIATRIGPANDTSIQGFAIDSNDNAYIWDINNGLGTANLSTGATADLNGPGNFDIQTICFDESNQLWGCRNELFTIDTGTGNYSLVGGGGYNDIRGIEIMPPVVEYSLRVTGRCPGDITIDWVNATPNATQGLVVGDNLGTFNIPMNFPCAGTQLDITGHVRLADPPGYFRTGPNGSGSRTGSVGTAACGKYLQLVEGGTCMTSNTDRIPN